MNWLVSLDDELFIQFGSGEDIKGHIDMLNESSAIRVIQDRQGRIAGRGRLTADNLKNLSSRQLR
jgi:NOL1/NOP2/fmu family ribosome biogenesis protein